MKRRMEQLLNGRYIYETPGLLLSAERIDAGVQEGVSLQGELYIGAEDRRRIKGMVVSSDRRLLVAKEKFSGTTACIPYAVDVRGLRAGERIDARLVVISNIGESVVPVHVTVEAEAGTGRTDVATLADFARLARADFAEAFRLYTSDRFPALLKGADRKYLPWYQGMSKNPVTLQHMEEFLVAAGRKKPVVLHLDREERELAPIEATTKDSLYIYRSGWGHVAARVEVDGAFLEVEKTLLTEDDFIGSVCALEYLIRQDRLGRGKNYGRIRICSVYGTLECRITAAKGRDFQVRTAAQAHRWTAKLARLALDYELGKLGVEDWIAQAERVFEELKTLGAYGLREQLMEAGLYDAAGEVIRAHDILEPLWGRTFAREEAEEEACFLALADHGGLIPKEQKDAAAERAYALYQNKPDSIWIARAILSLDGPSFLSDHRRMLLMGQLFEMGCRSPFLYLDAWRLFEKNENNLKKLDALSLQVLHFASRNGLLTERIAFRACHLAETLKDFSPRTFRLLTECYACGEKREMLESICKYIMKGTPRDAAYFPWYARAVEENVRITRLYEYYIETMPANFQEVLPQVIRMYFVYNNTLSKERRAMVYANVIRNKEKDRATCQNYRRAMEQFAAEALREGRVSEDYAVIYQECIGQLRDREQAEQAAKVIFAQRVFCDDPKMRRVIVRHEELEREDVYPLTDGVAYVRIYTPGARLIFEDDGRRRYAATVDYNIRKLLDEKKYIAQCRKFGLEDPGFLLSLCGRITDRQEIRRANLAAYRAAVGVGAFSRAYRDVLAGKILAYYTEHPGDDTLDDFLSGSDVMMFAAVDRARLCELLIGKGYYETAFRVVTTCGYEGVRAESLMRLASRMILETDFIEQEELVCLASHVFREGKYDDVILTYLRDNLSGTVAELRLLWERMQGFSMDTYTLEEEILMLAMFGRVHIKENEQVLESYTRQKGKEQVILAYLTFEAYEAFLGTQPVGDYIFSSLEKRCAHGGEMDRICRLALLKRYAGLRKHTPTQERLIGQILEEITQIGLRFAFLSDLPASFTKPLQLDDKIYVEARYPLDAKVMIHYRTLADGEDGADYRSEPMRNMYQGTFVKEFLLFYGEELEYYLTAETGRGRTETEKRVLRPGETDAAGNTRYQLINRMLADRKIPGGGVFDETAEKYLRREKLTSVLFPLVR